MLLLLFLSGLLFSFSDDVVTFVWSEAAELNEGVLVTDDESRWRLMEAGPGQYEGGAVILTQSGSRSGIAYFGGDSFSVTLLSGEPVRAEGFRTSLLLADTEHRRLTFTDGTTRRVIDPDADLDFPSGSLVEMIITRDRRYAIDLSRGLRIAVSPPMRK